MPRIPDSSIRVVRICPEHACRIFASERLLERAERGEFRYTTKSKPINPPKPDRSGKLKIATEEHFGRNDDFPEGHDRHIVFRAHCYRLDDGSIGASGLIDPKEMLIGDINYRQLAFKEPRCELCEGGDMIPASERFSSSTYRPGAIFES